MLAVLFITSGSFAEWSLKRMGLLNFYLTWVGMFNAQEKQCRTTK